MAKKKVSKKKVSKKKAAVKKVAATPETPATTQKAGKLSPGEERQKFLKAHGEFAASQAAIFRKRFPR
jgi:hypothetical protein